MTTLRVVVDQIIAPAPGPIGQYSEEITRALIQSAPRGCDVEGIVSAAQREKYERLEAALPGLRGLYTTTLPRRELAAAWQLGITASSGNGMIHAPGLFAPLRRHDRVNDGVQVAVTVHDLLAWTHPESLSTATVAWHKAMMRRARKHADAIVVPSHALAAQLMERFELGDRVRVIPGAARSGLVLPADAEQRAAALGLPKRFILTSGSLEPRKGVTALIEGLGRSGGPALPLVVLGAPSWGDVELDAVADDAGLAEGRVLALDKLSPSDLAVVLSRAAVFVAPSRAEGFSASIIEAFQFGVPVVHSDAAALVEVAGDAGVSVELADAAGYPERLADAVALVLGDDALAERMSVSGRDRSRAFSWRDAAERVWQLHADL
ncbi:glycosyltransferase family 4 protein [Microterricola pindariensis]|uniref:Mannosyltransferase n=1 Tax=Microterricola pindariensis TaxID=478010 RepID=A0ABX5AX75_9MICO|nr:glycosyltransferase family 1 protein [Microterricola pindariensis]PPL19492.1 mannosyltransferase [Microterricola pindariensis]